MEAAPLNCSVWAVTHLSSAAHDSECLIIQEHKSAFNYTTNVRVEPDEALSYDPIPSLCLALQRYTFTTRVTCSNIQIWYLRPQGIYIFHMIIERTAIS